MTYNHRCVIHYLMNLIKGIVSLRYIVIARFSFLDWAELLEACHLMSKSRSPQEKSVKKHVRVLFTHNFEFKSA